MFAKLYLVSVGVCLFMLQAALCEEQAEKEKSPRLDIGDIAKELLGRAGTSQVLSLNLTNLVILLLLKGLLFGATYYGGYGGHKARSLETEDLISESEVMLITSYLMGDTDQDFNCLHRVACQDPKKSKQYLQAAKVLIKGSEMFSDIIGYDNKYENLVRDMQDAIDFGTKYGTCEQKYSCKAHNNL